MDVNLNNAECLRTVTHIGYNSIHNVCNGAVTNLEWGAGDWGGAAGIAALITLCIIVFLFIAYMLFDITFR